MTRRSRHAKSSVMLGLTYFAAIIATLPLLFIILHLLRQGATYIRPAFFTEMPKPVGEAGGGMANAIVGTLILIGTASAFGLPVGIGAGLYLADQRGSPLATVVRFLSDVLNGLRARGHDISQADRWSTDFGRAQLIYKLDDGYLGASERRTDGQAVGY